MKNSVIGYQELCAAIVFQAAKDLHASSVQDRCWSKEFFFSDWFEQLMPKYDGPSIYRQIEENYNTTGDPIHSETSLSRATRYMFDII